MTATSNKGDLIIADKAVNLSSPKELSEFAATLKAFIVKEKLYTEIHGKNFVEVEGWQFAGAAIGILPVVTETIDLSTDKEVKYKATVELRRLSDNAVVGAGVAVCSNKETKKKSFDEYAIASMAQTRAVGKAYRLSFGWLMKMAGYQATPAEEVTDDMAKDEPVVMDEIDDVKARVKQRLAQMPTADAMRAKKDAGIAVNARENTITEPQWRRLDDNTKPQGE